jgi:Fe-S-cluster containining protein
MRPLPLVVPEGLRFTCHACGACCRGFTVALEEGEAARIARHDWTREGERFRAPFARPGRGPWGEPRDELLRGPDGACVFLDPADGLCLVEKRLGRAAKPRTCRKFPVEFVAAPDGLRAVVSLECESRWRSAASGAPLESQRPELEALSRGGEPYRVAWRVRVSRDGGLLSPGEYLSLEADLCAAIAASGPLAGVLRGLGAAVAARRRAAARGETPGASFDGALAGLLPPLLPVARAHAPEVADGAALLGASPGAWRGLLAAAEADPAAAAFGRLVLRSWVEAAVPGREPTAEDGVGRMIAGLLLVAATARALAPGLAAESGAPPPAPLLNRAARRVSTFLRGRARDPLREATGGFAPLCRAAVGIEP